PAVINGHQRTSADAAETSHGRVPSWPTVLPKLAVVWARSPAAAPPSAACPRERRRPGRASPRSHRAPTRTGYGLAGAANRRVPGATCVVIGWAASAGDSHVGAGG